MQVIIADSWKKHLEGEFKQQYFRDLVKFVKSEYAQKVIYPSGGQIFNAFGHCDFNNVKVVIIGQDPYHGPAQAMGLSFSVQRDQRVPPSLQNIFKEIHSDLGIEPDWQNGDLTRWASQGVLLLNATLTVAAGQPGSHQGRGWEKFTDKVIEILNEKRESLVFLLWGKFAQKKADFVDPYKHFIISSPHPSPFSAARGFFGSKPFSTTNNYLKAHGLSEIDWR